MQYAIIIRCPIEDNDTKYFSKNNITKILNEDYLI